MRRSQVRREQLQLGTTRIKSPSFGSNLSKHMRYMAALQPARREWRYSVFVWIQACNTAGRQLASSAMLMSRKVTH
jgi:hypothetical protein